MHELAITEGILKVILPAAKKAGAKRVLKVNMQIGELSGVIPAYLARCYEELTKGTLAEGSKLSFETVPAKVTCGECGHEGPIDKDGYRCEKCGSRNIKVTAGREYFIQNLEVE